MKIKDIFAKNNLFLQQTSYSCGPCTLLNVLRIKGDNSYTEEELIKLCEAKPGKGTDESMMVKVAKDIGLKVIEEKSGANIKDIEKNIDNGNFVIVCYQHLYSGVGHYGLIREYDDKSFYFHDCSYGFFVIEKGELNKFWYGSDEIRNWYMSVK